MFIALRNRLNNDEDGFTLIELLVVVIIIGILAAIAIPTFLNQRQRGWAASAESDARNAAIELETAMTNTGSYTAGTASFALGAASPTAGTGSLVPFKPSQGVYTNVTATTTAYCITARHTNSPTTDTVTLRSDGNLVRGTLVAGSNPACALHASFP